jgi:hypothetical protein
MISMDRQQNHRGEGYLPGYPSRCQHIKVNGVQCGSPALRRQRFCFFHKHFNDERIRLATDTARASRPPAKRPVMFTLPVLEDANSIQIALMQVMRLLLSGRIEHKTASLLLYALQTASANLHRTRFDPNHHDIILDPRDVAITPLNCPAWEDSEFEEEDFDEEEEEEDSESEEEDEDNEEEAEQQEDESDAEDKKEEEAEKVEARNSVRPSP